MEVPGKSKQIGLKRNTDCRETKRPNFYHVIDIGCIFNKSDSFSIPTAELKCITLNVNTRKLL